MSSAFDLWKPLLDAPAFRALQQRFESAQPTRLCGLAGSSGSLVLQLLARRTGRSLLIVVPDDPQLERYRRELAAYGRLLQTDPSRIAVLEAMDADPYDGIAPHPEVVRERVATLSRLVSGDLDLLLVPARGLLARLPSPAEWGAWRRVVQLNDTLPPDQFVLECIGLGYRRVDVVSAPAEICRRGGIVDVFPPTALEPVRIEFFGDDVDSIRAFDTDNQRSTGSLQAIEIGPAMESPPTERALSRIAERLERDLHAARQRSESARPYRQLLDSLENEGYWPGFEMLACWTAAAPVDLFAYAAELSTVVVDPPRCEDELARAHHELRRAYEAGGPRVLPGPEELMADPVAMRERLRAAPLAVLEWIEAEAEDLVRFPGQAGPSYQGRVPEMLADLQAAGSRGTRSLFLMRAAGSVDRVLDILSDEGRPGRRFDPERPGAAQAGDAGGRFVAIASIPEGFEMPEAGLSVVTERQLFGERRKQADRQDRRNRAAFISDFRDLKVGDLVVHVDHGIARYTGMDRPKGGSLNRDFITLEFHGGDKLFVPVDRLDLVQKHTGAKAGSPSLDRLGGPGWERVKRKARKAVESMARELLDLYAKRKAVTGYSYGPDTPWQRELEDAFPFELTPDQQRAVEAVKGDMESSRAMDRLLVGDVGFGKTEVAVRAAFKAVADGRQVAVLSPTTVLALQHFETFRSRYAPFPVRVEMVSRFRSAGEIKDVLRELQAGAVDVLIGTHRLLSKDVHFKSLGLLVVDEEQRFGVAHKERLKTLSLGVDVLSMTATPIPRTLQMSLAGVRDLSVIETPPPGRTAIQTYLMPFRGHVMAQAIRQELRRGGQVFFVHNEIETLAAIAAKLLELVPEGRILTAHGQMGEAKLEKVMLDFVNHEADILVTTTIIENGLDIPRANTIVVNRADRFGLGQLYQLRGRVGRSSEHAYAYFLIPGREQLTEVARKRLKALQEFSDLGAGFRLAAADLEIRGAGELLGARQHGHIAALGFDLYCQMLERAVQELSGEEVTERLPVSLNLGVDIKVPETFLGEAGDRLVLYKRLAQAIDGDAIDRLQGETEDRFGHLPQPARNLFDMARLRLSGERAGVKSIDVAEGRLQIRFHERPPIDPQRLVDLLAMERGSLTPSGMIALPAPERGTDRIQATHEVLERMIDSCGVQGG